MCFQYYKHRMRSCRQVTGDSVNALTVQLGKWRLLKVTHLAGGKERAAALLCPRLVG